MTRVFVYEYTSAAPKSQVDAAGARELHAEGLAMLAAALADFRNVAGVNAFTMAPAADEPAAFCRAARQADWSLVIAPEFNNILLDRCRWAMQQGSRLLNPSPETVALCGDKLALARHWDAHNVPTPAAAAIDDVAIAPTAPWIVKPRHGAGSLDTRLNGPLRAVSDCGPMIVQPFVRGLAASVAILCGPRALAALPAAEQLLSTDGSFRYLGGRLPLPGGLARRAERIARNAVAGVPELCGYVGVDVVLGDDGRDWAIEINPRLTTSYIGLRRLCLGNIAGAMLSIAQGLDDPGLTWQPGPIEFTAAGSETNGQR
jgi:predicted ATP-grasp superfamily ATP-dependent carboligase